MTIDEVGEGGCLLRVYMGESDRCGHLPLYEAVVKRARSEGLAGATVLRGLMGFGRGSVLHTAKVLRLSEDLPVVVEIVDRKDRVEAFLPVLRSLSQDCLITLERIRVEAPRSD